MTTIDSRSMQMTERQRFSSLIEPYRPALQAYCRSISRSSWEADDLVQDTWLKAYKMFLREPSRNGMSKTYLFRIAQNTWIDRCRKRKYSIDSLSAEQDYPLEGGIDPIDLRNAMEVLVANLPARQRIILLLVDMFGFSASETAKLVLSTEGAVKAGLHRARSKLKLLNETTGQMLDECSETADRHTVDEHIVYAYLQAFNQHNPYALVRLLNEETQSDYVPAIVSSASSNNSGKKSCESWSPNSILQLENHLMAA